MIRRWLPWVFSASMLCLAFAMDARGAWLALGRYLSSFIFPAIFGLCVATTCFVVYKIYQLVTR